MLSLTGQIGQIFIVTKNTRSQAFCCVPSDSQAKRLHPRIAGISPACGCTQPLVSEVLISTAFLFALRQSAGETPAIRWSRLIFKIAGISPGFIQIRRRDARDPSARRLRSSIFFVTKKTNFYTLKPIPYTPNLKTLLCKFWRIC
jgi:hypothetical protein